MGEQTKISWCDHSFNPWWGCTNVGPGCDNCYAERDAKRYGYEWGQRVPRRFFGDKHWNEPLKWNEKAKREGKKKKVFCASMADWADNEVEQDHRDRLFALIKKTDWLIWQLLTKRIGNAEKMLPEDWGSGYENVWFGITVVNQEEADRDIPKLLKIPARVRWLSIEPQIGAVDLMAVMTGDGDGPSRELIWIGQGAGIDWVVIGGESGSKNIVRPFDFQWARDGIRQCREAGVACFVKQLGSHPISTRVYERVRLGIKDYKGADPSEWPEDLRVQEFPK